MAMLHNLLITIFIMLFIVFLLIIIACKPWRFLRRSFQQPLSIKVNDLERPLVQEESGALPSQRNESVKNSTSEGSHSQNEGQFTSPGANSLTYKPRLPPLPPHSSQASQGSSLALGLGDQGEELVVGQTLKRPLLTSHFREEQKGTVKEGLNHDLRPRPDVKIQSIPKDILNQGCCLSLEVISGPARGLRCSVLSSDASKLPLTLGRVSPSNMLLKDSEVSGKHAMINWNSNKLKWELVDMGSLNGTLLNTKAVHHPESGSRAWGEPKELIGGDIITLGTTSQISVQITPLASSEVPLGVGIASDPMSTRRGGKRLPMEDVSYYQWPLPGADQFGLFGICDGHGGAVAAQSACKILPETVATILLDSLRREKILLRQDASDVLREAIFQTEASLNHYYEGCTATVLLVWGDGYDSFFAQCANVGDSACIMNIDGKQFKMTEDHRITSYSERQRINETGDPLKDGDTRLCGLNLGRMLGDKFLKEQDARFSSEPHVSEVVRIGQATEAFALLASDGLWDRQPYICINVTSLETTLRNYSCLTTRDSIMVAYNNKKYYIDIIETRPAHAISIIETDCEVDFAPPLDYIEPEKPAVSGLGKAPAQAEEPPAETEPKFNPFTGVGRRLDGKPAKQVSSPVSTSGSNDKQPALPSRAGGQSAAGSSSQSTNRQSQGKLVFGSGANSTPKEAQKVPAKEKKQEEPQKEEPKFQAFQGKKYSLRG